MSPRATRGERRRKCITVSKGSHKQDPELLAIGRIRRLLATLTSGQRMNALRYITEGEFTAQREAQQVEKVNYERNQRVEAAGVDYERGFTN